MTNMEDIPLDQLRSTRESMKGTMARLRPQSDAF